MDKSGRGRNKSASSAYDSQRSPHKKTKNRSHSDERTEKTEHKSPWVPLKYLNYLNIFLATNIDHFCEKYANATGTRIVFDVTKELDEFKVYAHGKHFVGIATSKEEKKAKYLSLFNLLNATDRLFLFMWLNYQSERFKEILTN